MPAITRTVTISNPATFTPVGTISFTSDSKINIYIVNQTESSGAFTLAVEEETTTPVDGDPSILYKNISIDSGSTFVSSEVYVRTGDLVYVKAPIGFTVRIDGETLVAP